MAADVVDCDVAIIGYGPVGATLAGLLAGRGDLRDVEVRFAQGGGLLRKGRHLRAVKAVS